ncbi:MAG: HAD family hydrolase [Eubacterium sp.]|nr:HAD family hydrolase [Eubacterium sp.]
MTERFKAAVFDMDGVIFDSEKIYRQSYYKVGEIYGFSKEDTDRFCEVCAGGTREKNALRFKNIFGDAVDYSVYRAKAHALVDEHGQNLGFELKKGARETLEGLKNKGIKIALATSTAKERAEHYLSEHDILKYFDEIVYGDQVEHGKPEPDIFLKACEKLNVNPEEAVGIEDSINGVRASHSAGLYTVMVIDLIMPNDVARQNTDQISETITEILPLFGIENNR